MYSFLLKASLSMCLSAGYDAGSILTSSGPIRSPVPSDRLKSRPAAIPDTIVTDTLPNGMRYYIKVNKNPAKRAFLWLSVNAGSIHEDETQLGFAHLLEHMAFNGTTSFPGNTLIDVIEKAGMQFGADLNAYTSFDETVYQLTIPTDEPVIFNQGLQILD